MDMDCRYTIQFYNDWHCGSGLAAGADVDALVVKDRRGLPFVPGKTVKGMVREAMEVLCQLGECSEADVRQMLGIASGRQEDVTHKGVCNFSNAAIPEDIANAIIAEGASQYLYRSIASTAINDEGVAKQHSLRSVEVTVPCSLTGVIYNVPKEHFELLKRSMGLVKRMGQSRNRGLGRCDITLMKGE